MIRNYYAAKQIFAALLWTITGAAQVPIRMAPAPIAPVAPVAPPVTPVKLPVVSIGPIATPPPPSSTFYLRSYLGRCLDTTNGQVVLADCNSSASQQIEVDEVDPQHDVVLRVGNLVLGINVPVATLLSPSASGTSASPGVFALELQSRANLNTVAARNQIFALDGDSIILASSRACFNAATQTCPAPPPQLVVQTQNASGAKQTPVVVGPRTLADNEFWDMNAADGSGSFPTTGFHAVATSYDLWNNLCSSPAAAPGSAPQTACAPGSHAGPGTVIVVTGTPSTCSNPKIGGCMDFSGYPSIVLPAGVTVRGNRRGANFGPQLYFAYNSADYPNGRPCGPICQSEYAMFEINGDYVRVTGLRLRGQSRDLSESEPYTEAIQVDPLAPSAAFSNGFALTTEHIAIIDHNDLSDWGSAAVNVYGPYHLEDSSDTCHQWIVGQQYPYPYSQTCSYQVVDPTTLSSQNPAPTPTIPIVNDPGTLANVRIERNFLHNNERWGGGYGASLSAGGRAVVAGNTFLMNRHSIASDGEPHSEYRAWYNLVLSDVATYNGTQCGSSFYDCIGPQQDFDMHGTRSGGYGGMGGYAVDIAGNTFLDAGQGNYNFELRGHPVSTDYFRDNVTIKSQDSNGGGVINLHNIGGPANVALCLGPDGLYTPVSPAPDAAAAAVHTNFNASLGCAIGSSAVFDYGNQFGNSNPAYADPTAQFGVGDFDGDGRGDLFLATGTAWYYSATGSTEWRFLSAKPDTIGPLLFGDFDGDGRTDVAAIHGGRIVVSWGGVSAWQFLNTNPIPGNVGIADMAAGRFLDYPAGDASHDIFCTDGTYWYVSYGGSGLFGQAAASRFRVADLRFGDFNGDGKTDVFSVQSNGWDVAYAQSGTYAFAGWTPWPAASNRPSPSNTINGLVVGDFTGTGRATVATACGFPNIGSWCIAEGAPAAWHPYSMGSPWLFGLEVAGIGHFGGPSQADVLLWNGKYFSISAGGLFPASSYSSQEMR